MSWVPAWLGRAYSKLYLKFKCEPFTLASAQEALETSSDLARVVISRLKSAGLASTFSKAGKKRVYRLLDPETWVIVSAAGAKNLGRVARGRHFNLICAVLRSLIERYRRRLVSVVLYGSVARGHAGPTSDLDLLIVCESFSGSVASRIDELVEAEGPYVKRELAWLAGRGIYAGVSYLPLRPEEALHTRPLYLDLVYDAVVLYDAGAFFESILANLRERLAKLGAKRVFLGEDEWYWILKPSIEVGEVIEV